MKKESYICDFCGKIIVEDSLLLLDNIFPPFEIPARFPIDNPGYCKISFYRYLNAEQTKLNLCEKCAAKMVEFIGKIKFDTGKSIIRGGYNCSDESAEMYCEPVILCPNCDLLPVYCKPWTDNPDKFEIVCSKCGCGFGNGIDFADSMTDWNSNCLRWLASNVFNKE